MDGRYVVYLFTQTSFWTWLTPVATMLGPLIVAGATIFVMKRTLETSNTQHANSLTETRTQHSSSIAAAQQLERTKWKLDKVVQEMAALQERLVCYKSYVYDMRHRPRDLVLAEDQVDVNGIRYDSYMSGVWQREASKRSDVELAIARVTMICDPEVVQPLDTFTELSDRFRRELRQAYHTYDIRYNRSGSEDIRLEDLENKHLGNANLAIGELEDLAKQMPSLARQELAADASVTVIQTVAVP